MIGEDPADATRMRISDADRDKAASVIGAALAEGRLTADEHAERLDGIYASRTHAEILPLVSDLPGAAAALQEGTLDITGQAGAPEPEERAARMIAVFSTHTRRGLWRVPRSISAVNVFGHTELDLRDAVLPGKEVRVRATCVLGDLRITVPPEMHVIDSGWALFGGREFPPDTPESARHDAPVLRVTGVSIFGLATVRRENRERRKLEQTRAGAEIPAQDPEVPGQNS